ncbi:MAG: hypothetical protein M1838_004666 [Thelocarpon superellum]|nr:MAG: hypothetical protein M1838_004666 [Thelocarpon superellum]
MTHDTGMTEESGKRQSHRTNSMLLPEKPILMPATPAPALTRPISETTEIEDERSSFASSRRVSSSCHTSCDWLASHKPESDSFGLHLSEGFGLRPLNWAAGAHRKSSATEANNMQGGQPGPSQPQVHPYFRPSPLDRRRRHSFSQQRSSTPRNSYRHYSAASVTTIDTLSEQDEEEETLVALI